MKYYLSHHNKETKKTISSIPDRINPKTMKLVFVDSPLSSSFKEKEQKLVGSESG
jgi:hypothetical protein